MEYAGTKIMSALYQVISPLLCEAIRSQEMLTIMNDAGCIHTIMCFLNPKYMVDHLESTTHHHNTCGNQSHVNNSIPRKDKKDSLYMLFVPDMKQGNLLRYQFNATIAWLKFIDPSDESLCHSIANMVAIVLGCPDFSNHLWCHMFAPDQLVNTYLTGFMVRNCQ